MRVGAFGAWRRSLEAPANSQCTDMFFDNMLVGFCTVIFCHVFFPFRVVYFILSFCLLGPIFYAFCLNFLKNDFNIMYIYIYIYTVFGCLWFLFGLCSQQAVLTTHNTKGDVSIAVRSSGQPFQVTLYIKDPLKPQLVLQPYESPSAVDTRLMCHGILWSLELGGASGMWGVSFVSCNRYI